MGRASLIQNAFNAGELSALLLGRQDLQKYGSGLYVCLNGVPLVQGAWTRRPGFAYLHQCRHHDKLARVIPFEYSLTQTYILEFGEEYIRFFTDHGILTKTAQNITGITNASPAVVTYSGADTYANNDRVFITGVVGMTVVNNREFVVTNVSAGSNTFQLYNSDGTPADTSTDLAYASGGTVAEIVEVATDFQEDELVDVRVTQSADTLYIFHPDYPPQVLVRTSATTWSIGDIPFTDGPYDSLNATSTTLTPSAATGAGVTLTASAVTGINDDQGFLTTDVGRLIRIQEGSTWGYVVITAHTSTTVVTVTVLSTLTNTNPKTNWRMGIYSDTTGFPRCGTFHEDRLFMAGAATYPQRIDGSKTGIYTNFSPSNSAGTVADDNAVAFALNSDDVNTVLWMHSDEKGLLVGTAATEWQVRPSSLNEAITPTNISGKPTSHYGSSGAQPVRSGKAVLFPQRAARKLRELAYVFEVDGFKAPELSLLAEHITRPSIDELALQQQPQTILWGVRGDGVLLGMTYERDQDVVAWHRHELGGFSDSGQTLVPVVESIAAVPTPDATRDELYAIVQRYINGGTRRYIEYQSKIWENEDEQEDAFQVDCGWTIINPAGTLGGLWHLEGETVAVYADGKRMPDTTITNGYHDADTDGVTIMTLGYLYNSDAQTMPVEGGSQDGSAQGKVKRIHRVGFWLLDTFDLQIGPDFDNLTPVILSRYGDVMGEATPLFTGVTRERFESDYDRLGQVAWRADGPFPATVLAVMPQLETSDAS